MTVFARSLVFAAALVFSILPASAQRAADTALYYVANTRPPDAFLALRTQPTSATGSRIVAMPNGTALRVLERRGDGWWRVRVATSGQEGWALASQGNRTWIECCVTASVTPAPEESRLEGFRTPSNNIHCQFNETEADKGVTIKSIRCDVRETANRPPPRPRDCDLEWGQAFELTTDSRAGERLCYGDTVMDPKLPPLVYGQSWEHDGLRCRSEPSGVTCTNPQGHGFELSRTAQRVF